LIDVALRDINTTRVVRHIFEFIPMMRKYPAFATRPTWCLSALCLAFTLGGCGKRGQDDVAASPKQVPVVAVHHSSVAITAELPGRLAPYRQAEVRARAAGIVTARTYQEGQAVKRGEVLFRIDPAPYRAARDVAKGALAKAQAAYLAASDKRRRYRVLAQGHAISERELTEAIADERQAAASVASAKAELARAELQLGYTTVTAPISGHTRRALVTEGALVGLEQATLLTTVEQTDPIYVNFAQPAMDVDALRRAVKSGRAIGVAQESIEVTLVRADGSVYPQKGKLLFADFAVDSTTDSVSMRAVFPNPERELLSGAYVSVRLDRAIERNVILVPRDAVLRTTDRALVKVVGPDDRIHEVEVEASQMKGHDWIIARGLQGGERVVVVDAARYAAGEAVTAIERDPSTPMVSGNT
jgi:multidrug efflux system membrane fusion protein